MISIICASNNKEILNNMLIKSLKMQTFNDYELIVIDAKEYNFKSASQTLNYGAIKAKGDILVFIHQDILFLNENCLEQIVKLSNSYEFGIAGVAGTTGKNKFEVSSSVTIGKNHRQAGKKNYSIIEAYTLDECLLIIKKDKFLFFKDYGPTWHFYGVEYSNRSYYANEKVLIFPIEIYHISDAKSLDYSYFNTLKRYAKENKSIKIIRTCCGYFSNNLLLPFYCVYRKLKIWIKKIIKYEKN